MNRGDVESRDGCSKVSLGCAHCYAETLSLRFGWSRRPWLPANAGENVVLHPERLEQPLQWRRPRLVFVNSMSDLFHELVPLSFVTPVFDVMAEAHRHTFQILTKRHDRLTQLADSLAGQRLDARLYREPALDRANGRSAAAEHRGSRLRRRPAEHLVLT
jgi:protein gp37